MFAQISTNLVYVDPSGRLKWTENNEEAFFFGVNYSVPFAFSYRALKNKGISHKDVIDFDVHQFKKLELNAYRIHVWDREVSDRNGNLLINEHIELLDYLISKLIENDIYIILTPIAWWGTGWPEPDYSTPGFSSFYSKIESTTKPEVIKAQINYLKQFVNHINPYTGKSYKDENKIIAFEIFNEPNLPRDRDSVKNYVNTTLKALRGEGFTKPIFFNISENPGEEQWIGVASSDIDGISFQWYPTGLVKNSELKGNFLPNVLSYPLNPLLSPLSERGETGGLFDKIKSKAKMVYEFDAADIGKSYMYPVMAHSFREAGMQWAAMFCYDPTPLAQFNSEYQTHYLNLLYTPKKALSFLISSNLFKEEKISEKKLDSTSVLMNNVLIDYEHDLSLLNTSEKFYYSNNNTIVPIDRKSLNQIAGFGSSKLIEYDGRGSYFLNKLEDGIWHIEIYPDAVWVKDPFGRNNLQNPIAKLIWKPHKMKIQLPDIKENFKLIKLINNSIQKISEANNFAIELEPGSYIIADNENITGHIEKIRQMQDTDFEKIKLYGEFINDFQSTEIKNLTPKTFRENEDIKIKIEAYSKADDIELNVFLRKAGWRGFRKNQMQRVDDFTYEFKIPDELKRNGMIEYFISIIKNKDILTFPGKLNFSPEFWGFNQDNPFELSILPPSNKIIIYDPDRDKENIVFPNIWRYTEYNIDYIFNEQHENELNVNVTRIRDKFPELAIQIFVGDYLKNVSMNEHSFLELEIREMSDSLDSISIRCIFNNVSGFERKIPINQKYEKILIPIADAGPIKYALLPRPYPTFLPYWFSSTPHEKKGENIRLESIQISLPLNDFEKGQIGDYGIKLKRINFLY